MRQAFCVIGINHGNASKDSTQKQLVLHSHILQLLYANTFTKPPLNCTIFDLSKYVGQVLKSRPVEKLSIMESATRQQGTEEITPSLKAKLCEDTSPTPVDYTPNKAERKKMGQPQDADIIFSGASNKVCAFDVAVDKDNNLSPLSAEDWQALWCEALDKDPEASIFQHPAYVLFRDEFSAQRPLIILRIAFADSVNVAVLKPIQQKRRLFFGYLPDAVFKGYLLAGKRIIGPDPEQALNVVLKVLPDLLDQYESSLLLTEDLENHTSIWETFAKGDTPGLRWVALEPAERKHKIRMSDGADSYWAQFSKSTLKEFRRILRKNPEFSFLRITEPEKVETFLSQAHEISSRSWQANVYGNRVPNDATQKALFKTLASLGLLRCYLMYSEEKPIAFEIAYQYKNYVYGAEVGFDQSYRKLSPGNLLMYKELEDLFEHDTPRWYDFGEGDAPYKGRFSDTVTNSANIWMMRKTPKNSFLLGLIKLNASTEASIHWLLEKSGLKARVRQLYRRIGTGAS